MASHLIQLILFLIVIPNIAPKPKPLPQPQPQQEIKPDLHRIRIPLPQKRRVFIDPETIGLPKEVRAVRDPIIFECPCCGAWSTTQALHPFLPVCYKCKSCIVREVDKIPENK